MTRAPGAVLSGKYRLVRLLGEGACASVWQAENLLVGRHVAVKLLRESLMGQANVRQRFLVEGRAAARIAHPNVVDVFDLGSAEGGQPYIVMELCNGESLNQVVEERGAVGTAYACDLTVQVLAALDAAHAIGIVHRDLKPGNVMVVHPKPDTPVVKVLDFGIAQGMLADKPASERGKLMGTPEYMAPEQATGDVVDERADVYSAGAMLFELLTGRPPFVGATPMTVLAQVLADPAPRLSHRLDDAPPDLEALIAASLSKDPDARPQSAAALSIALARFTSSGRSPSFLPQGASARPLPLVPKDKTTPPDKPANKLELVVEPSIPPGGRTTLGYGSPDDD